jgi:hypothetical protein
VDLIQFALWRAPSGDVDDDVLLAALALLPAARVEVARSKRRCCSPPGLTAWRTRWASSFPSVMGKGEVTELEHAVDVA